MAEINHVRATTAINWHASRARNSEDSRRLFAARVTRLRARLSVPRAIDRRRSA